MPENILPKTGALPPLRKKRKVSGLAVLMVIVLSVILIILGEFFLRDINRWFNPAYDQYGGGYYTTSSYKSVPAASKLSVKSYDQGDYETFRILLHSAVVVPIVLAAFLLYFILFYKKEGGPKKIIVWPYFLFALWMFLHLIIEFLYFLVEQYETLGLYIVLIILAGILTWLVIFLQKKFYQKQQMVG